ncbi:hypothetical protein GQ53DRAFT_748678, partial [Thozetella sp. PMI_491]
MHQPSLSDSHMDPTLFQRPEQPRTPHSPRMQAEQSSQECQDNVDNKRRKPTGLRVDYGTGVTCVERR